MHYASSNDAFRPLLSSPGGEEGGPGVLPQHCPRAPAVQGAGGHGELLHFSVSETNQYGSCKKRKLSNVL